MPLNPVISDWYIYGFADHSISARPGVYAVRTQAGQIAVVEFDSYYCPDGSAGCVTFHYRLDGVAVDR